MNIYKFEFKMLGKSVLTWGITIVGVFIMFMSFFPMFSKDSAILDSILANYPEEMLKMLGMASGLNMASVLGYLVFVYGFIQLFLAIQASNYGFSILTVEERELTADFLLSKPISRQHIIISKVMAAFTAIFITNIVLWGATFVSIILFAEGKTYEVSYLILFLFTTLLFQLFFMAVSMVISVSVKKVRSVLSFSMALSFGMYIINGIQNIVGGDILGYFTPFHYFDPSTILESGSLNISLTILSLVLIVGALISTYILYIKRNIHSL